MLTVVIHMTIFRVMFKAWPYLIIMKMMSHLQLILSKNSSPGWGNIPTLIGKHVIHCYIKPLVFLINQSLIEGVFYHFYVSEISNWIINV